ncbi:winged helix-turn-helix transcriptional regulator [Chitinimonas prasina]|uniref:winged helix-turn-helix transcriptional regulator n=1 Tax=Chitinimonas prasina TaxID=1434937 RepID=UPI0034D46B9F
MKPPKLGSHARGSVSGRPVMVILDLLGRRWAMRVLWELSIAPRSFRELQAHCENASSSVLNTRLGELREANLVELGSEGYLLTANGAELMRVIAPLREWAETWAAGH